jgi:reductive dehalogenase
MAFAMSRQMYRTSPSHLSQAASNLGYARMGFGSMTVANYIRFMGYNAIPCKNSTGPSIPMAIDAGLGEEGRNGILVTPEYGPLIRLDKVLTNMPLIPDKPIKFGVEAFCDTCRKCARECPSKAITHDDKTWTGPSICNNPGIKKWHINAEKCVRFWIKNGSECANCIAVCPFNKGAMWTHDATRLAIKHIPAINGIWLAMDDGFGYGAHWDPRRIWNTPMGTYGLDPEHLKNTI